MSKTQRVESLIYKLNPAEGTVYQDPPPLEVDQEKWKGRLESGVLTCHMKVDYGSVSDARKEVERYLRAWEIDAGITNGRGSLRFVHQDAVMVDTSLGGEGDARIRLIARGFVAVRGVVKLTVKLGSYPPPPNVFVVSPDVETLWARYEGYLDGRESLQSMAYFCLTVVEEVYGGQRKKGENARKAAARTIEVDYAVLNELGRLTSTRGDSAVARKAPKRGKLQPLNGTERTWIEAVIKTLIRRAGEYAGCDDNSTLDKINVQDFPPLG
jgi:hypothetical protein